MCVCVCVCVCVMNWCGTTLVTVLYYGLGSVTTTCISR